jgi:uracil-DNA glycosylase family 4
VAFREAARAREPAWHNAPVPSFGDPQARLLIVGLAPGLRGANRTGRPFTGDWAGDLLYETLALYGFSSGTYDERPDDGLVLRDCAVTNAVRCVPPANKPLPSEIATCRGFLSGTRMEFPGLKAIVALGRVAHESVVRSLALGLAAVPFGHGAEHDVGPEGAPLRLFDSSHCSRYNTNTGVLTPPMVRAVFARVRALLDA